MVWPVVESMKMRLLGLQQDILDGQGIISVGYLGDNKALKAPGRLSTGLDHNDTWNKQNGFIHRGNAQRGQGVRGSTSADLRQTAFYRFVVAEGCAASHDGGISSSFR